MTFLESSYALYHCSSGQTKDGSCQCAMWRKTNRNYNPQLVELCPNHVHAGGRASPLRPDTGFGWNFQRTYPMSLVSPWIIRLIPQILLFQVFPYLLASMSALASCPAWEALATSTVDSTAHDLDSTLYLAPVILG